MQHGRYGAALARYKKAYPELFDQPSPRVDRANKRVAIDVATVYQKRGDAERAGALLAGAARVQRTAPRLGIYGFGIADVQIDALQGQADALAALRMAERAGWHYWWRYHRDFDPALASIRDEPEFKTVFAAIERDMAHQRAELAARPKDLPLDLATVH